MYNVKILVAKSGFKVYVHMSDRWGQPLSPLVIQFQFSRMYLIKAVYIYIVYLFIKLFLS